MDYYLFTLINNLATRSPLLDVLGIFLARVAIFLLPFFAFIDVKIALVILARMTASTIVAFSTNAIIGLLVVRPRPFTDHNVHQLITLHFQNTKSFPSDHTAIAFALATTVALMYPKAGIAALIVAGLIGLARIYVGVHYPFDIVGGVVVGVFSALLIHFLFLRFDIV